MHLARHRAGQIRQQIERSAANLVAAVVNSPPPGVAVRPSGDRDGAPRIRLDRVAPAPSDAVPPIDTPAVKR